ncbi:MAG: zinc-binding dehydrogenase, partial [Bacteroidales bacterium]|nr:zinc-binding dehydrogenase [Bacteroidales bacterium]
AGGQVPEFMRVLAADKGIQVINIVRKEQQVEDLKKKGEKYAFNSNDDNFDSLLQEASIELKPTLAFDAVAGDQTGQLLNAMPEGAEVVVYGGLSDQPSGNINPMGLIFKNKTVSGFNLGHWIDSLPVDNFEKITQQVQDLFIEGKFHTEIQAECKLNEAVQGIRQYLKSMSAGKILLVP